MTCYVRGVPRRGRLERAVLALALAIGCDAPLDAAQATPRSAIDRPESPPAPAPTVPGAAAPIAHELAAAIPGQAWISPTLDEMRWIPPGTFTMGSPIDEPGRSKDETAHQVTLTRGFWIMRSEVTAAMWSRVMGPDEPSPRSCGADCPVEGSSWSQAEEFARRAAVRDGVQYRLASEAQWEWAARGGASHRYAGSDVATDVGWVLGNANGRTHPVCGRAHNGYGLCDMTGNLAEWVADWYGAYGDDAVTDPEGPPSGSMRVIRGGSAGAGDDNLRVARRDQAPPDASSPAIGFRLVRVAP